MWDFKVLHCGIWEIPAPASLPRLPIFQYSQTHCHKDLDEKTDIHVIEEKVDTKDARLNKGSVAEKSIQGFSILS